MSGLSISCGEFRADDKSGSAFERVLKDLPHLPDEARQAILAGFDDGEFTRIATDVAAALIPHLRAYQDSLIAEIGHSDSLREIEREERTGICSVKLKWGEGRGWRLYCTTSLLAACEHSAKSRQPVTVYVD